MTRSEAIEHLETIAIYSFQDGYTDEARQALDMAIKALEEPERKTGRWINAYPDIEPNPMFMYGICSVCGCEQAISNKLNFCPDCGADMRGEQDG